MKRLLIAVILYLGGVYSSFSQSSTVDSLRQLLPEISGQQKIQVLQSLVINLWLNHPDTAMQYAREAINLAVQINDVRSQAIAVRIMGGVHLYQGTYDSALYYSKKAHELSIQSNDSTLISSSLNNIGFTYYHLGSYAEALENLLRALNLKFKIKQDYGLGQTLNNVGLVYSKLKDFSTARKYFTDAIQVSARLHDNNIKLYSNNNIGFTYLDQGNLSQAEAYFKQSLEIAKRVNNKNWHAAAYSGLAQAYYRKGLIDRARKQFRISLALRNDIGDKNGISEIYYYFSKMYAASGNLDSAFINAKISQVIVGQTKAKERLLENYELYKELYTLKKKYDSALYFQSKYIELRDKLFNENLARNLADIQMKIQEEETIQRLAAKDVQIQKRTIQINFLVAIALLILVFAVIVYWYYDHQKKLGLDLFRKNQEISSQKEEIESQKEALVLSNTELERAHDVIKEQIHELAGLNNKLQSTVDIRTKELESANRELKLANLELDNFIYKSSHDIKGPLVRLLGVCHVALLDIQDTKAREYIMMLNDTAKHVNDIFDRLKIVSDINNLSVAHELIEFQKIVNRVQHNLKDIEGFKLIEFKIELEDTLEFYSDAFLIETIIHNMVENAVKFQKKSLQEYKFIRIGVKSEGKNIKLCFTDNGIGIKDTDVDHMFKMFSKAALEHQSVGLGLYIVKQCVNKLDGTISLLRNKEKLTEFEVRVPVRPHNHF